MKELWIQLWSDEDGGSLIEYVLIVALIALASVGAMNSLKTSETTHFTTKAGKLNPANK